jgi:hypothetical protein
MWDLYFGDMDGGALTLGDAASFEVQASSNLLQWSTLTTSLVLTNGLLRHQEPHNPAGPRRFYRVLERF